MEMEAQRKIDQEDALGQSEIDAAAAVLAAAEDAEDVRYHRLQRDKFKIRMMEDNEW